MVLNFLWKASMRLEALYTKVVWKLPNKMEEVKENINIF